MMKKFLKIAGSSLLAILLLLLVLPFVFRGKILEIAKQEVNKMLDAEVDFDRLSLSFIRSFPHASIGLENFHIIGTDEFEGDTLFFAQNLSATVNIRSFFGNEGYEITRINVNNANVHAIVRENGNANWNIVPTDENQTAQSEPSDFKLLLQRVSIRNMNILFDDLESSKNLVLNNLSLTLSGDMTADETRIRTNITVDELTFLMNRIPYLSQAKLSADVNVDADLKNMRFTLSDNHIQINEIRAGIDGWVAMQENDAIEMDIRLNAPQTQFKDILSMIPAIYTKDFQDIRTSGDVTLTASAQGTMYSDVMPAFDMRLSIGNAMFQYPTLPKAVTSINANVHIHSAGGVLDNTVVDISAFNFDLGGNPFSANLRVSTPMSDPNLTLNAIGRLDLGMIKEVYPLEDMELSGVLDANMALQTRMSYIENEQFDRVNASGTLNISGMDVKSTEMDDILISKAHLSFNPHYVDLTAFQAQIGKNDISATGKLENFIPYFMTDATLRGTLTVASNFLNLNDFMQETHEESDSEIGIIVVPQNLDFNLNGRFNQVIFDKLDMTNVVGQIVVRNGKVDMRNLSLNALGGSMTVNGHYDTSVNPTQPEVSFALDLREVSFAQTFSTFVTIQRLAPIFESLLGNFSTSFRMTSPLGSDFMPILTSLTASGLLESSNVSVGNIPVLDGLASALNNDALRSMTIRDLNLPFAINEGRVTTRPFDVRFGGGVMNLSGSTGLDQSIDYVAKIDLTDRLSNNILRDVNVRIGGTFTNPTFNVDMRNALNQAAGNIIGNLLGSGNNENNATLTEQASEQIARQAANIRQAARDAGDRLISEAERQGQNLVDEAGRVSNAITRIAAVRAAEATANRLREEAQRQADRLNEEAEKQVNDLSNRMQGALDE